MYLAAPLHSEHQIRNDENGVKLMNLKVHKLRYLKPVHGRLIAKSTTMFQP
jgi:hypothetical protein